MNKIKTIIKWMVLITIIVFSILPMTACNKDKNIINETKQDICPDDIVGKFIECLFSKNENVLNYCIGNVKKNVYNNFDNIDKKELIDIKNIIELAEEDFSIIHSTIEYKDKNGTNVTFYRFKLINIEQGCFIYKIEETTPIFSKIDNVDNKNDNQEIFAIIDNYFNSINDNKLEEGITFLIGKAKRNHILTYKHLTDVKELSDVKLSNIKHKKIFDNGKLSVVEVDYNINDKSAKVIVTLYKTHQGWLIYDVE